MRPAAALLALALAPAACSHLDAAQPMAITPGQAFTLAVGGTAVLARPAVRLGFDSVVSDSRCPQGEQCVVAGEAVVRMWSQAGELPRQWHALHLGSARTAPRIQGLALTLTALAPPPVSGQTTVPSAYRATFMLVDDGGTER